MSNVLVLVSDLLRLVYDVWSLGYSVVYWVRLLVFNWVLILLKVFFCVRVVL